MPKIEGIALKLAKERLLKQKLTGKPISSATEKLLNKSFSNLKREGKQFFRYEGNITESMNRGFTPSRNIAELEPDGQYYALKASDIPRLLSPDDLPRTALGIRKITPGSKDKEPGVMRAALADDAKVVDLSDPKKWIEFVLNTAKDTKYERAVKATLSSWKGDYASTYKGMIEESKGFSDRLTRKLKEQGTHVIFPDVAAGQPDIPQLVALEPEKTIAKKGNKYSLMGLAGAAGAISGLIGSDKAEAGVKDKMIGAPLKSARNAIKGELSSAWKDLAGTEFKGQTIKYITKGKGDLRYIILNDDTVYPVSKEVVHSLSKAAGTKKSLGEFSAADAEGKLSKAYKSLKYHMSRAYGDENAITDYSKRYTEQIKLSGLEPPKLSLVEADGKKFTMPKDYADLLTKEGTIKKLKDLP